MRIAFISTVLHLPWGGADTLWTRAAELASERGDSLLLAIAPSTAADPRIAALLRAGAVYLPCPPRGTPGWLARLRRKCGWPANAEQTLDSALAQFRPDLVLFSQGGTYDLLLYPRVIASLIQGHTPYRVIANWQQENPTLALDELDSIRRAFEAAQAVFFVSSRNLAVTRRHLCAELPNARVIQNPLRWRPEDRSPWPAEGPAHLATVSRLDEGKGIHLLLHALAEIGTSLSPWQLTIHGRGPAEAGLRDLIARLSLGEQVHLAGHVPALRAIWASHELLCSPAIDEGVPMTIPEAMLCGRPVLATCVGGAEDWLQDNVTGFLSPAPTVPLLAETLQRAIAARARWSAMGMAAAAAVQARYRPDDFQQLLS